MLLSCRYLVCLLGGAILSGWAGSLLRQRGGVAPTAAGKPGELVGPARARDAAGSRESTADFATQIRTMIAECTKNPSNATHIPEWEKIRGFDLAQVQDALRIAGDPLVEGPGNTIAYMLLSRWAELDPQAALASVAEKEGDMRDQLLAGLLGSWMEMDPDAAYRWAGEHPPNSSWVRPDFMRAAAMLSEAPEIALEKSKHMPEGVRLELVSMLARSMSGSEEERARCFGMMAGMSEADRLRAAEAMVTASRSVSPRASLELMETLPLTPEALVKAREMSLNSFSREQPAEAFSWLQGNPAVGGDKERGLAFNSWFAKDESAATAWLEGQPDPAPLLAAAVNDVNLKMLAAQSGETERARQGARLRTIYNRWQQSDPESAARWLGKAAPDVASFITTDRDEE